VLVNYILNTYTIYTLEFICQIFNYFDLFNFLIKINVLIYNNNKMKKIIGIIMLSILLTSCGNKSEETKKEPTTKTEVNTEVKNVKIDTKTENTDVKDVEIWDNTENSSIKVEDNKVDITITPSWDTKTTTTTKEPTTNVSDEEALETEVNDLLDEFIDSLDSYDK